MAVHVRIVVGEELACRRVEGIVSDMYSVFIVKCVGHVPHNISAGCNLLYRRRVFLHAGLLAHCIIAFGGNRDYHFIAIVDLHFVNTNLRILTLWFYHLL